MENNNNGHSNKIDPVGIELLLAIFSTAVTVASAIHQFGLFPRKREKILTGFENLNQEIMKLQNTLDDFILTAQRYSSDSSDKVLEKNPITISGTLMYLKERDYLRWIDIHDSIKRIDSQIYLIISKIRSLSLEYFQQYSEEPFDNELLKPFDELILNMSRMTFGEFIKELRELLNMLSKKMYRLIVHEI